MAANTAGVANSFKLDLLVGSSGSLVHNFVTGGGDTFKMALYLINESITPTTTAYTATGEVPNTGTYAAGGSALAMKTPAASANSVLVDANVASIGWTGMTSAAFDTALLYNSSKSNKAVAVYNFGSQTITAGALTLTMPASGVGTSLLELD